MKVAKQAPSNDETGSPISFKNKVVIVSVLFQTAFLVTNQLSKHWSRSRAWKKLRFDVCQAGRPPDFERYRP